VAPPSMGAICIAARWVTTSVLSAKLALRHCRNIPYLGEVGYYPG
jgi:hypothetical protein